MPQSILRVGVESKQLLDTLQSFAEGLKSEFSIVKPRLTDAERVDLIFASDKFLAELKPQFPNGSRPSLFVCVENNSAELPISYVDGIADDMFVLPARRLEFLSKLRLHQSIRALRELEHSSVAVPALVAKLQEDVILAQKIQRHLIRDKFPPFGALSVKSKYWCGLKSGGDYFDVFEFPDKNHVGILLTDSSSYSLSTVFFGSLMQFSPQFSEEEIRNPGAIVTRLFGGIRDSMKPKDALSIFYGILDRKTFSFRYVNCGSSSVFLHSSSGNSWLERGNSAPLTLQESTVPRAEELILEPADRLVVMSDGWEASWSRNPDDILEKNAALDAQALVNEMSFQMRKAVGEDEDGPAMPSEDCSVLILDVAKNVLRLAT